MNLLQRVYRLYGQMHDRAVSCYWKFLFRDFGKGSTIHGKIFVHYPENIVIGEGSTLNQNVVLNARAPIVIGSMVHISYGVIITAGKLVLGGNQIARTHSADEINIKDGVWIGSGAIILPGVTIGKRAVVGAGSVVTRDIASNCVVAGSPAVVIRRLK